jgi:hypothetical protein
MLSTPKASQTSTSGVSSAKLTGCVAGAVDLNRGRARAIVTR